MSATEIKVDSKKKMIEISCKIFADDLQQALAKELHQKVDLYSKDMGNKNLVCNYVKKHLEILLGNQKMSLICIGYEIEEEAVWCYLELPLKRMPQEFVVSNTILCAQKEGQTNLVHVVYDGLRTSTKLNCPDASFIYKK